MPADSRDSFGHKVEADGADVVVFLDTDELDGEGLEVWIEGLLVEKVGLVFGRGSCNHGFLDDFLASRGNGLYFLLLLALFIALEG